MSETSPALLWLALALAFAFGFGLVYVSLRFFLPALVARFGREEAALREDLMDIFFTGLTARQLLIVKYGASLLVAALVTLVSGRILFGIALGVAVYFLPGFLIELEQKRRRKRLEGQVNDLIAAISATTKSGMTLVQSIEEVARKFPPPMSQEFDMILQRIQAGQTLEAALDATEQRLQIPNISLVLRSLVVNLQRGGKLVSLLEKIGVSLREISKVEEKVENETAGIRLSSKMMAAMPVFMLIMLHFMAPENVALLFETIPGNLILIVAAVLTYTGFRAINKIADIDA